MTGIELRRQSFLIDEVCYVIDALKDNQQYDATDGAAALGINDATWPLFGLVWPTSIAMAMNIYKLDLAGKRVLEIGCGLGLCSIVLHRMGIDVTASDYHPRVHEFLTRNVSNNGLPPIKYQAGNWNAENPELGRFDVVIGSDVLYQPNHAGLVSRFIDRHSNRDVEVVIGDPDRANRAQFSRDMSVLGYRHRYERFSHHPEGGKRSSGRITHYRRCLQSVDTPGSIVSSEH